MRFLRFTIFAVLSQLSPLCRAQFVYFNEYIPELNDQCGTTFYNVEVTDSNFIALGSRFDFATDSDRISIVDFQGIQRSKTYIPVPLPRSYYFGDIFSKYSHNKFISAGEIVLQNGKAWGTIDVYDDEFNLIQSVVEMHAQSDTFVYSFDYFREYDNGNLLLCGTFGLELDSGLFQGDPWIDNVVDFLQLRDSSLNVVWTKTYFGTADEEVRNSDMVVLNDGKILVGGYHGPGLQMDNFILKLSSTGDSLDYVALGGPCSEYGVKFTIMPNGNILAAYESCQSTWQWSDAHYSDFHLSVLDPNTLDIIEDHTYPQPETSGLLINVLPSEILPTVDGGYAYMVNFGYGVILVQPAILKVDSNLDQQWFHTYTLSALGDSQNSFMRDLDLTPDSGFIAVGKSITPGVNQFRAWALKIDACGDEQNLGCWPVDTTTIATNDISTLSYSLWPNPTSGLLHVQSESVLSTATVYDLTGRIILHKANVNSSYLEFDTSTLPANIYVLRIMDAQGRSRSERWVKE